MNRNKYGFTLVELLVVIAIIGILSTVAVVNLQSARTKAKVATLQGTSESIYKAATYCINTQQNLRYDGSNNCSNSIVVAGTEMCDGVRWPQFSDFAGSIFCTSDVEANSFNIVILGGVANGFDYYNYEVCNYNNGTGSANNKCTIYYQ